MKRGVFSVDAPVSGGDIGARNATLSIMIGGNKQTVDDITPLFETMGKNIRYMGIEGKHSNISVFVLSESHFIR